MKHLDCPPKPGGFRASRPRSTSNYACLRSSGPTVSNCGVSRCRPGEHGQVLHPAGPLVASCQFSAYAATERAREKGGAMARSSEHVPSSSKTAMSVGLAVLVPGASLFLVGIAMTTSQDSIGGGLVKMLGILLILISAFMIISSVILWGFSAIRGKRI